MHFLPCPQHAKDSESDNVWTTHTKIDQNKFYFSANFALSSNRRVRNLTFYFQFTTLVRKLTHRMKFEHAEKHEFWKHHNSSLPWAREMPKSYPERHEFQKCHVSSPPWAREMPKVLPRKTRISETPCFFTTLIQRNAKKTDPERQEFRQRHNSSLPWARELPNPTVKYTNFAQNCTH